MRLLSFTNKFETTKFVFAWDSRKSYRKDIYPDYKKRPPKELTPEEEEIERASMPQFGELRTKILPKMGFKNIFIQTGLEGDDIIASAVYGIGIDRSFTYNFIVVTDDKDLYQLLDHCDIYRLRAKKIYTKEHLMKEWDCAPTQWASQKVYSGCKGDNVPNIKDIGTTRAIKYVKGELKGKFYHKIKDTSLDFLKMNKRLVQLPFECTQAVRIEDNEKFNLDNIISICEFYGLYSLTKGNYLKTWRRFCHE